MQGSHDKEGFLMKQFKSAVLFVTLTIIAASTIKREEFKICTLSANDEANLG